MLPFCIITALSSAILVSSQSSSAPGYTCYPHCIAPTIPPSNNNLTFGQHYAVLNLDLINGIVGRVNTSAAGQAFINSTASWIDAVHAQQPAPLSVFTRIYFSNAKKPEIKPGSAFAQNAASLTTASDPLTEIYPSFHVDKVAGDVVLRKVRYYAGAFNELENILRSQSIDTVVISGIRTSGVILSTVLRLYDLDYQIYVIANNTIESPPNGATVHEAILEGIFPKLPVNVITLKQALAALGRSGPAIY